MLFLIPLTALIGVAVSSKDDPIIIDLDAITSGKTSIAGASTSRPSGRTTSFILGTTIGAGSLLSKAGSEVTQSGITGGIRKSSLRPKGPRLVTSEGFVDVLKGTGTADNILATTRNVQASFIDDAGKLVSVGQKDFGVSW